MNKNLLKYFLVTLLFFICQQNIDAHSLVSVYKARGDGSENYVYHNPGKNFFYIRVFGYLVPIPNDFAVMDFGSKTLELNWVGSSLGENKLIGGYIQVMHDASQCKKNANYVYAVVINNRKQLFVKKTIYKRKKFSSTSFLITDCKESLEVATIDKSLWKFILKNMRNGVTGDIVKIGIVKAEGHVIEKILK